MKDELLVNVEKSLAEQKSDQFDLEQSLIKSSPFGSFFLMVNRKRKQREAKGIKEAEYINLRKKPYVYRKGNRAESNMRSLCIVLDGSAKVINRADKFEVHELTQGSHFGSSDLLRIPDIEYFGDIYAGERGLKLLVVARPDQVLQLYERRNLQEIIRGSLEPIRFMVESKYNLNKGAL